MKIYLVGGAVRDKLLGIEPKERDWVVVGSSPDEMKSKGFKQVGKDFPVFIHSKSGEEYALARTERKSGHGYTGFEFDINSNVTLEEDLERRDLTINAMAEDQDGTIIDPFNGQKDIKDKKLRHVSDAFSEDPLRVLRVLRFKANLSDFDIVPATNVKINEIINSGELEHLTGERIWLEIYKTNNLYKFFSYIIDFKINYLFPGILQKFGDNVDNNILQSRLSKNKLHLISHYLGHNCSDIDSFAKKLKVPNEYTDLAKLYYNNKDDVSKFNFKKNKDYSVLLKIIKNLDIRKKERLKNFFELLAEDNVESDTINFFKSLISKIQEYKLNTEDKSKSNLEIKKIIENAHSEIAQNHIKEFLNNKQN